MVAIMTPLQATIVPESVAFSHDEAVQISRLATANACTAKKVIIDLARAEEASTSAFARLVLLRRILLKSGRDLRLTNLSAQAAALHNVNRLTHVLPTI
jgi:ABC-type transporter Mla MlaB component